ncbi:hypothetical protein DW015_06865 [Ruminococcus sp. AF37-20]|nr:hypothetical protein DW015_06865 [Ruminococcus sp. AF37-20]
MVIVLGNMRGFVQCFLNPYHFRRCREQQQINDLVQITKCPKGTDLLQHLIDGFCHGKLRQIIIAFLRDLHNDHTKMIGIQRNRQIFLLPLHLFWGK